MVIRIESEKYILFRVPTQAREWRCLSERSERGSNEDFVVMSQLRRVKYVLEKRMGFFVKINQLQIVMV